MTVSMIVVEWSNGLPFRRVASDLSEAVLIVNPNAGRLSDDRRSQIIDALGARLQVRRHQQVHQGPLQRAFGVFSYAKIFE